jgi:hypothetical protein
MTEVQFLIAVKTFTYVTKSRMSPEPSGYLSLSLTVMVKQP